jgi:hypothetical protein
MPLASFVASGRFGPIVYDRRNIVRRFVFPHQPNTSEQLKRRLIFKAATIVASLAGQQRKNEFMAQYSAGWYAQMIKRYCETKPRVEYEELTAEQQADYDDEAVAGGIAPLNTEDETMFAGEILYRAIQAFAQEPDSTEPDEFLNWWKS